MFLVLVKTSFTYKCGLTKLSTSLWSKFLSDLSGSFFAKALNWAIRSSVGVTPNNLAWVIIFCDIWLFSKTALSSDPLNTASGVFNNRSNGVLPSTSVLSPAIFKLSTKSVLIWVNSCSVTTLFKSVNLSLLAFWYVS